MTYDISEKLKEKQIKYKDTTLNTGFIHEEWWQTVLSTVPDEFQKLVYHVLPRDAQTALPEEIRKSTYPASLHAKFILKTFLENEKIYDVTGIFSKNNLMRAGRLLWKEINTAFEIFIENNHKKSTLLTQNEFFDMASVFLNLKNYSPVEISAAILLKAFNPSNKSAVKQFHPVIINNIYGITLNEKIFGLLKQA